MASKLTPFEHEEVEVKEPAPVYKTVGLGKPFHDLVMERQRVTREIKDLTDRLKSDDENDPGLNMKIEMLLTEKGLDAVAVDELVVLRLDGKNVSIKRETLQQAMLEYGIPADDVVGLIDLATITKAYSYIQVQKAKNLLAKGKGKGKSPEEIRAGVLQMKSKAAKGKGKR